MAITNYERVGKALDLLKEGLRPFVERELEAHHGKYWVSVVTEGWKHDLTWPEGQEQPHLDAAAILKIMWDQWNQVFSKTLGHTERSMVSELREVRNRWAHQEPFSSDDTYRALDSSARLLTSISAEEAAAIEKMKMELLRLRFDEQVRNERRKTAGAAIESRVAGNLKPWREVITPHRDVASGRYQQAEFAADLWQVYMGEGSDEYREPAEFFRRTYLTESLRRLLNSALQRLSGSGGDPVVQLQTNFGGGKTHSMLALYHLFSGVPPSDLTGVDGIMEEVGAAHIPGVRRVVLVGNKISPGNPSIKSDGTIVHTLWGELAWQLGGREAYERVRADDEQATSPGDLLRVLFNEYGPCLILIDEWVAYARQLHDQSVLPAGSFETQFSFAQVLSESAKLAQNCLLVVSLPASDREASPHTQTDDAEVGGQRGRDALHRLHNVIGRVDSSWRPATAEEGFEIVRRRLFEPLIENEQFVARDLVARSFADLYRTQHQEFPAECRETDYERRLKAAYPIHPEIFDRLYTDWSTLVKFQRTRGVLRLMAAVINSLWEKEDRNPLILPCNISIDDPRVEFELTRYLSDNWVPVIKKDVDGPNSLPLQIDGQIPNLGRYSACRRVARTVYLGSAPIATAANRGLEDRRVKLGCVMPGESTTVFGDALRRLSSAATYLYEDGTRYWYSTQPTVTKLAEDRAEQFRREPDKVEEEINKRLRADLRQTGDFYRIHPLPQSGQDVPDDQEARLVVLGIAHPHSRGKESAALVAAREILEMRGNTPRIYRNTLVFFAADNTRLQELGDAVRFYLAWESILGEREALDLSPYQVRQAEAQRISANSAIDVRLPEAYQWLLVPVQSSPQAEIEWQDIRVNGREPIAERASRKLRSDELLVTGFAATRLRMDLDRIPLWRGDHVAIRQLIEDYSRYLYLSRLKEPTVLLNAIRHGLPSPSWRLDAFAYADSYDESACRYRGLCAGEQVSIVHDSESLGLLVKPEVAQKQVETEKPAPPESGRETEEEPGGTTVGPTGREGAGDEEGGETLPAPTGPKRFYGSVELDSARVGRDAGQIAEEVISHLKGLVRARVKVTLEIEAEVDDGVPENVVRTVTENSRTLRFTSSEFEKE
jgi:predicted AAA+ superfamily ATPase